MSREEEDGEEAWRGKRVREEVEERDEEEANFLAAFPAVPPLLVHKPPEGLLVVLVDPGWPLFGPLLPISRRHMAHHAWQSLLISLFPENFIPLAPITGT